MGTELVKYEGEPYQTVDPHIKREKHSTGTRSLLDDPELIDLFARALSDGWNNKRLADAFNVSDRSVRNYKKDPRVKAAAFKYTQERVLLVTRKTDSEIERRLENPADLDLVDLLRVRKEFLGGAFRNAAEGGKADDRAVNEAMDELEGNPDLAAQLLDLLGGKAPKAEAA